MSAIRIQESLGEVLPGVGSGRPRRSFLRALLLAVPAALAAPEVFAEASAKPDLAGLARRLGQRVDFKPRTAWTREAPEPHRMQTNTDYHRITVHHAGNGIDLHTRESDVVRDLDGIRGAHLRRRFGDIGYHYAIDRQGRVWEARPLTFVGAHVQGFNEGNLGIMLLGNFEMQRPSAPQVSALHAVTGVLCETFRVPAEEVYGHRDLGHTLCPGRYLYSYVNELKKA